MNQRISWPTKVSNEELLSRCEQECTETILMRRRQKWIGHVLRRNKDDNTTTALHWIPERKRKRVRLKNTWRRMVQAKTKKMGYMWGTILKKAQNRQGWRFTVFLFFIPYEQKLYTIPNLKLLIVYKLWFIVESNVGS